MTNAERIARWRKRHANKTTDDSPSCFS